ncbi:MULTISPECIES: hypothetical protein [Bradyrhizobium]|uniref:hypothetical protein n=1 Tax=Bradyrhizobium TaxID=374 RepID=UPI0015CF3E9D|nr:MULTISPECIES: hypothetical protein [Bradyrhizobium]
MLDRFCLQRLQTAGASYPPRVATTQEASAYRHVVAEFADATRKLLVPHLG